MDKQAIFKNLMFYSGKIPAEPDGAYIDEILGWFNDMRRLETGHGYIQWLFPTRESGSNPEAFTLLPGEAAAIRANRTAMKKFRAAYEMMLHFFGINLINPASGEVARARNWKTRFANLNRHQHNFLRITRIILCLNEMGLEKYQYPLVDFLTVEVFQTKELWNAWESCLNYWIPAVKNPRLRRNLKARVE